MNVERSNNAAMRDHFAVCLSVDSVANAIAQLAWDKDRVFDRELALIGARAAVNAINAASGIKKNG